MRPQDYSPVIGDDLHSPCLISWWNVTNLDNLR